MLRAAAFMGLPNVARFAVRLRAKCGSPNSGGGRLAWKVLLLPDFTILVKPDDSLSARTYLATPQDFTSNSLTRHSRRHRRRAS